MISRLLLSTFLLSTHVQLCGYLMKHVHGFGKLYSTQWVALLFAGTIRRDVDKKDMTAAIFIDSSRVFDGIDHSILLKKLSSMNIVAENMNGLRITCVAERKLLIIRAHFQTKPVTVGEPQGPILALCCLRQRIVFYLGITASISRNKLNLLKILMLSERNRN